MGNLRAILSRCKAVEEISSLTIAASAVRHPENGRSSDQHV